MEVLAEEYVFNPNTDKITRGKYLKNGLLVMPDSDYGRKYGGWGKTEERSQQFARVTQLEVTYNTIQFVGVWDDEFQHGMTYSADSFWITRGRELTGNDRLKEMADRAHLGKEPWGSYKYDIRGLKTGRFWVEEY